MSNKTQQTKYAAMIIYLLILACLIVSLFIPVFDGGVMLFREIPGAFARLFGRDIGQLGIFIPFGLTSYYSFNLAALAVVIYTITTAFGVIAFFVMLGMEKTSRAPVIISYIFEILAILSMLLFAYDRLSIIACGGYAALSESGQVGWVLFVTLAVVWLLYTLQAIIYQKGAGFAKSVLFVLSAASFLCLFLSRIAYNGGWIVSIADRLKSSHYFIGEYPAFALVGAARTTFSLGAAYIAAFITSVIVLANLALDAAAIAAGNKKIVKTFNLARYGAELVCAIVTAIIGAVNGVAPGIYLYLLMALALAQIVISTIRMFTRATFEEEIEYGFDGEYENEERDFTAPATEEQIKAPGSVIAEGFYEAPDTTPIPPPVYTRSYAYQDDSFLNSLSPSERAEFYAIFIDKRRGNFYFLPEYEIGGENVEFFQSMFIYLGKIMGSISDGLMNKIYRRLNMLT